MVSEGAHLKSEQSPDKLRSTVEGKKKVFASEESTRYRRES